MNEIQRKFGTPNPDYRPPFRERSRAAWRIVRPHWYRTAWWVMLGVSILVIALDVNAQLGGFLFNAIEWFRTAVLQRYPSVSFVLGVLACYYVFVKGRFLRGIE
jgi:hypothetical protein